VSTGQIPLPDPPPGPARTGPKGLPAVTWRPIEALVLFAVGNLVLPFAITAVAIAIGAIDLSNGGDLSGDAEIVFGIVADLAFLAVMWIWLARRHPGWRAPLGLPPASDVWREIAAGGGAGLVLYPVVSIVAGLVLTFLYKMLLGQEPHFPDQLPKHLSTFGTGASVVLALVVAPVVEELYYRGFLFRSIRDRRGFWLGAIVSAIVFGLVHLVPAPWRDVILLQSTLAVTGFGLAAIHEWRGTIVADWAAHVAFNVIGIVLILTSR
jgi:membrane protease YdiL (CAAX protease family)